ncbi:hypothetical protein [Aeromicrobium sp.]|uniref:hypothetical protein n=1 Tax=Aeromicrobium sp. TaxID=1871063 RepID=UPI003D6B9324
MALTRREIAKDVVQQGAEAAFATAGHVTAIFFDAARRITTELGAFGTEIFEIAEASRKANDDDTHHTPRSTGTATHPGDG